MLQKLASKAIVDGISSVKSLHPLPNHLSFNLYKQIRNKFPWNETLLRLLDSIDLTVDCIFITSNCLCNPKYLSKSYSFYQKHSKFTIRKIVLTNDQFISFPKMPKVLCKFTEFPIEQVEFQKIEFDQVKITDFLLCFTGRKVDFVFEKCSGLEELSSGVFKDCQIQLLNCMWKDLNAFKDSTVLKIKSDSPINNFLPLPSHLKWEELWIENVDLTDFVPNDSLKRLLIPKGVDFPKEKFPFLIVTYQ